MKNVLILIFVLIAGMASAQSGQVTADTVITGIEEDKAVSVYPNPASDFLTIQTEDQSEVTLIDLTGRKVFTSVGKEQRIALNDFSSGVYIVKVSTANHRYLRRVLIQ